MKSAQNGSLYIPVISDRIFIYISPIWKYDSDLNTVLYFTLGFQVMRISWHTERAMALTPPTGDRVQAHGNGTISCDVINILETALIT